MEKRVLVVEDDAPIREMVGRLLSEVGCDVQSAPNGLAALRVLQTEGPFDLVVLDMGLPMMDGWQLAQRMREEGLTVPILVMTAGRDARRAAADVGAVGYIGKPFDIEELEGSVRRALADGPGNDGMRASYLSGLRAMRSLCPWGAVRAGAY